MRAVLFCQFFHLLLAISSTPSPPCIEQVFFECLNSDNSVQALWYKGIQARIHRVIFQRVMITGQTHDHSAESLYETHIRDLSIVRRAHSNLRAGPYPLHL